MSWGTELWDQYDTLAGHTNKGIDFLERYGHFLRDRCAIENEYAAKLRRLVKNYQPKKKEEEDYQFSSCRAFKQMLQEVNDLAGQREVVAETLTASVLNAIVVLAKEVRDERKRYLTDGTKMTQTLVAQVSSLERARRCYEKAFRESERALDNFHKADDDFNLSRAEVEKQKNNMTLRAHQCEDAKTEYANQLQKTNELQRTHYSTSLPEVFNRLQELDERRVRGLREFLRGSAQAEIAVQPIIDKCLQGICTAADRINEKEDSALVIERYKSGFTPPVDFPFDDLSKGPATLSPLPALVQTAPHSHALNTVKGTLGANRLKKRVGLFGIFGSNKNSLSTDGMKEDYSDLPPNQQRKRLAERVAELRQRTAQEAAARDGLMKMKGVYEANPALGDPMTIEGQLNESEHKLEKLRTEVKKFEGFLEVATTRQLQGGSPQPVRANGTSASRNHRNSNGSGDHEEGSLSRSASDSSVAAPGVTIEQNHGNSASPESGLGTSHSSLPGPAGDRETTDGPEEFYYEADSLQPLGSCRALYPFEATSEGSIPMSEGEELQVMELDQGDGWTRVRRLGGPNGWEEGFVPTSYIESTLFA